MKRVYFDWGDLSSFVPGRVHSDIVHKRADKKLATIIRDGDHRNLKRVLDYVINENPRDDVACATWKMEDTE